MRPRAQPAAARQTGDRRGAGPPRELAKAQEARPEWDADHRGRAAAGGPPDRSVPAGSGRLAITDAGLKHLSNLTNLAQLDLHGTQITDAGLVHLAPLVELRELSLSSTAVTDNGLAELAALASLRWLCLSDTHVTDAGIKQLSKLPNPMILKLIHTDVTEAGLEPFKRDRPMHRIDLITRPVTLDQGPWRKQLAELYAGAVAASTDPFEREFVLDLLERVNQLEPDNPTGRGCWETGTTASTALSRDTQSPSKREQGVEKLRLAVKYYREAAAKDGGMEDGRVTRSSGRCDFRSMWTTLPRPRRVRPSCLPSQRYGHSAIGE